MALAGKTKSSRGWTAGATLPPRPDSVTVRGRPGEGGTHGQFCLRRAAPILCGAVEGDANPDRGSGAGHRCARARHRRGQAALRPGRQCDRRALVRDRHHPRDGRRAEFRHPPAQRRPADRPHRAGSSRQAADRHSALPVGGERHRCADAGGVSLHQAVDHRAHRLPARGLQRLGLSLAQHRRQHALPVERHQQLPEGQVRA